MVSLLINEKCVISKWSALGSGLDNEVYALAVSGSDLYAAGYFNNAGGVAAKHIAKWNGNAWSALGLGINAGIPSTMLVMENGDLYVGGGFSEAGGISAHNIAKWNGSGWSALGLGVDQGVFALAVMGGDLYVGGAFSNAGGSNANRIAKWDGSNWLALGQGVSGGSWAGSFLSSVRALAVVGSNLYVGGVFTRAGEVDANYIAKWDGSAWSALGSGVGDAAEPAVFALAVSGMDLFAGGNFTAAGGAIANYIAKWDGNAWSGLDSGMTGWVTTLAVSGSALYAGGEDLPQPAGLVLISLPNGMGVHGRL